MTWSCSRCHGVWRQRSHVRWYELWLRAISDSRPFCCTTCGRRAWSAVPEGAAPIVAFTAPVDEVHDVSLVALDAILSDVPPAESAAGDKQPVFDDDPLAARPRQNRAARRRKRARGAETSVH